MLTPFIKKELKRTKREKNKNKTMKIKNK